MNAIPRSRRVPLAVLALLLGMVLPVLMLTLATSAQASVRAPSWGRFLHHCHQTHVCHLVPAAIRADLRLGHRPARIIYGDTSRVYAEIHGRAVLVSTS